MVRSTTSAVAGEAATPTWWAIIASMMPMAPSASDDGDAVAAERVASFSITHLRQDRRVATAADLGVAAVAFGLHRSWQRASSEQQSEQIGAA